MRKEQASLLQPTLQSLVWPLEPAEFLDQYWHKRAFASPPSHTRLKRLLRDLKIINIETLDLPMLIKSGEVTKLIAYPGKIKGETPYMELPAESGSQLYQAGFVLMLYLNDAGSRYWHSALASELGIADVGPMAIFVARKSTGTEVHFDWNENFTIQLRGNKRWWVAPNPDIPHPLGLVTRSKPFPPGLRQYREKPAKVPSRKHMKQLELHPGSVLYVPRGWWHATESHEESFSLTITFSPVKWMDLLVSSLQNALTAQPEWRAEADGAFGDVHRQLSARKQLETMLPSLVKALPSIANDLFPETCASDRPKRAYQRNMLTRFYVPHRTGKGAHRVVFEHRGAMSSSHATELPEELVGICRWIGKTEGPFEGQDIQKRFSRIPPDQIRELTKLLVAVRYIRENPSSEVATAHRRDQ